MTTNDKVSVFALTVIAWLAAWDRALAVTAWLQARQKGKGAQEDERERGALP